MIFATLGEVICERSGVLNLGIEGIMSLGAMVGWMSVYLGADLYSGILIAALTGALFGLLHAIFTVYLGASQHVTGIGITMFASSVGFFSFKLILPSSTSPPKIIPFEKLERKTQHNLLEKLFEGKLEPKLPSGEKWIKQFRSYLMFAFYTSQRGASNQLAYLPIPGKYIGEISLEPNQKAWTL